MMTSASLTPEPSFPGSAWERTPARLCLAPPRPGNLSSGRGGREAEPREPRSQAEPGNEVTLLTSRLHNAHVLAAERLQERPGAVGVELRVRRLDRQQEP